MAIENRNLSAGTKLWARYKSQVHTAEVIAQEGRLVYRLADGREFGSPSAAGTAITGKSCNGWSFWSVGEPTEKAPKPERAGRPGKTVNAVPKPTGKATGKRTRQQPEPAKDANGHVLPIIEQTDGAFECGNCGASFPTQAAAAAHLEEAHPA
jgi:hypothetical protein